MGRPKSRDPKVSVSCRVRRSRVNVLEDIAEERLITRTALVEEIVTNYVDSLNRVDPVPDPEDAAETDDEFIKRRVRVLHAKGMTTPVALRQAKLDLKARNAA